MGGGYLYLVSDFFTTQESSPMATSEIAVHRGVHSLCGVTSNCPSTVRFSNCLESLNDKFVGSTTDGRIESSRIMPQTRIARGIASGATPDRSDEISHIAGCRVSCCVLSYTHMKGSPFMERSSRPRRNATRFDPE